jgi:hypothetical protein
MSRKYLLALATAALAVPAAAHHSFAMFDMEKDVTVVGSVTEFKWTNPHAFMMLDITGASGATSNWAVEMTSPNNLLNVGWRRSSLKPGDRISVTYHPLINGKQGGALVRVKLANGTILENK